MSAAIAVEQLAKRYGDVIAVDRISFEVAPGEIFGLLGPNGSGKTTTVECLQGLRHADGGTLRVLGLDPRSQTAQLRKRIGSQLQESSLPDHIKVWEALSLFASIGSRGEQWRTLLHEWGLQDKERARFSSLSGGQRQRLFVALALVNRPEAVFFDEMTTGLDPQARRVAWDLIAAIRERGATVVLVTHFMDEAEALCDRLAVMRAGHIVAAGTPSQLIRAHAGQVHVSFSHPGSDVGWLAGVTGVERVDVAGPRVDVVGAGPLLARVAHALVDRGIEPDDLRSHQPTLEDVFLSLTGPDG